VRITTTTGAVLIVSKLITTVPLKVMDVLLSIMHVILNNEHKDQLLEVNLFRNLKQRTQENIEQYEAEQLVNIFNI
jgi:hypothetical protein